MAGKSNRTGKTGDQGASRGRTDQPNRRQGGEQDQVDENRNLTGSTTWETLPTEKNLNDRNG